MSLPDGPSRNGLKFENWYEDEALKTPVSTPAISSADTEDKTFYGKYSYADAPDESGNIKSRVLQLYTGSTLNLRDELKDILADDSTYTWQSEDDTVAAADQNGVITGKGAGETEITVLRNNYRSFVVNVRVSETTAALSDTSKTIYYKESFNLGVTDIAPADGTVSYESENPECVSVSDTGVVTGLKADSETNVNVNVKEL